MRMQKFATGNTGKTLFLPKGETRAVAPPPPKPKRARKIEYELIEEIEEPAFDDELEQFDKAHWRIYRMGLPDVLPPYEPALHTYSEEVYNKLTSIILNFNIGAKPFSFGSTLMFLPSPKLKDVLYHDLAAVFQCNPNDVLLTTGRTIRYLYNWKRIEVCRGYAGQFHAVASGWGFNAFAYPDLMTAMVNLSEERLHVLNLDDMTYRVIEKEST